MNGQDNLKIRNNNSGDIIAFGTFSGILDFGNGTVLGEISSEDEGYFLEKRNRGVKGAMI